MKRKKEFTRANQNFPANHVSDCGVELVSYPTNGMSQSAMLDQRQNELSDSFRYDAMRISSSWVSAILTTAISEKSFIPIK